MPSAPTDMTASTPLITQMIRHPDSPTPADHPTGSPQGWTRQKPLPPVCGFRIPKNTILKAS